MNVSLMSTVATRSLRARVFSRRTYAYFRFLCGGLGGGGGVYTNIFRSKLIFIPFSKTKI
jgi:hypothetical protein